MISHLRSFSCLFEYLSLINRCSKLLYLKKVICIYVKTITLDNSNIKKSITFSATTLFSPPSTDFTFFASFITSWFWFQLQNFTYSHSTTFSMKKTSTGQKNIYIYQKFQLPPTHTLYLRFCIWSILIISHNIAIVFSPQNPVKLMHWKMQNQKRNRMLTILIIAYEKKMVTLNSNKKITLVIKKIKDLFNENEFYKLGNSKMINNDFLVETVQVSFIQWPHAYSNHLSDSGLILT